MNKNSATSFQKHQTDKKRQCFRNVVAPFLQKCVSDQREELHFCRPPPILGLIGQQILQFYRLTLKIFQIQKKPSVLSQSVAKKIP